MSNQRSLNSSTPTLNNQNARFDGSVADHVPTLLAEDAESKTLPNQVQTMRGGPASRMEPPPPEVRRSIEPPPPGVMRSIEPPPPEVRRSIEPPPPGVMRSIEPPPPTVKRD